MAQLLVRWEIEQLLERKSEIAEKNRFGKREIIERKNKKKAHEESCQDRVKSKNLKKTGDK